MIFKVNKSTVLPWSHAANFSLLLRWKLYARCSLTESWIPVNFGEVQLVRKAVFSSYCYEVCFTGNHFHLKISKRVVDGLRLVHHSFDNRQFIKNHLTCKLTTTA